MPTASTTENRGAGTTWAKVIDHTRCIGCHACTTACKSENEVPLSVTRTFVKYVDVGTFPDARRAFQVTRCNQCEDAPCVAACPTAAMFSRSDGIVDFDKSVCIGCKACIAACPYDAIFINPVDHSAEKCNFCAHRLDVGLEPACVVVCPVEAILVGDMTDPESYVSELIHREPVQVRRPEKRTRPKLFYNGADARTLDPLGARRPEGGLYMWSEQGDLPHQVPSGHPGPHNSSAAAVVSYDIPHRAPWDWRVSAYTWTKSIAAGGYLVAVLAALAGWVSPSGVLAGTAGALVSLVFLALTGALLIWDLEHPARFYMIFTRPQWRSWLVRGGVIITLYGGVLTAHLALPRLGFEGFLPQLGFAGVPLAVLTAIYTAFLFGQSKGRDLWQNPLLAPHLLIQAVMAGAGVLAILAQSLEPAATQPLNWILAAATGLHLMAIAAEFTGDHPTEHAALAARQMVHGRYAGYFGVGVLTAALGLTAPFVGSVAAVIAVAGLLAYEHAYVQAGQSVPLA